MAAELTRKAEGLMKRPGMAKYAVLAVLCALYYVAGKWGLSLAFVSRSASAVWPPTGIAFAALLVFGYRVWPAILLGAFLVNIGAQGSVAASLGVAVGNTLEGICGAYLVKRFAGGVNAFDRPQDVFRFAGLVGLVSTPVGATLGVTTLCLGGYASWHLYGPIWLTWWMGDTVGGIVVGPLLVVWLVNPRLRWNWQQFLEGAALALSLLFIGTVTFGKEIIPFGDKNYPIEFVCTPFLIWAAFRFGQRGATAASVLLSAIAIRGTVHGFGPYGGKPPNEALLLLQARTQVAALMSLVIAAAIAERKRIGTERDELLSREQASRQMAESTADRNAHIQIVTAALSAALIPEDVARIVINQCVEAMDASAGVVALLSADEAELKPLGATNHLPDAVEAWRRSSVSIWDTPLGEAVRTGEPILMESTEAVLERYPQLGEVSRSIGEGARVAFPLQVHGRVVGGMWLAFRGRRTFTEEDRSLLIVLTQLCAEALERARLFEAEQAARSAAESANRLKDEFLATVSHELRTPLTAILGWSQLLRSGFGDAATRERGFQVIERNAKAQAQIVDEILDVSRIITGKLRLSARPIELTPVIEAALDTVRPSAEAKGVRIEQHLDPAAGAILGDAERLQQVVWNLLANAVKFTPGGRVEIALRRAGSTVEIEVHDTGVGISADFLPHLFERFRQGDASSTRAHGGLGLGLAIVRHLVELHGGTVGAQSPGAGQGATFTVRLPLATEADRTHQGAPHVAGAESVQHPRLAGLQVLAVDDEPDSLEWIAFALRQYGAEVRAVSSSPQALQELERFAADILISDLAMPDDDGYSLIRQVRALERQRHSQRHLPAIALTSYATDADEQRALEAGYQMHLAKPVDANKLAAAIVSSLEQTTRP